MGVQSTEEGGQWVWARDSKKKLLVFVFLCPFSLASIYFDIVNLHQAHGKADEKQIAELAWKHHSMVPSSKEDSGERGNNCQG